MLSAEKLKKFIVKTNPDACFIDDLDPALVGLKNAIEVDTFVPVYDMDMALGVYMEKFEVEEEEAVEKMIERVSEIKFEERPCFVTYFRTPETLEEYQNRDDSEITLENSGKKIMNEDDVFELVKKIKSLKNTVEVQRAVIQEHVLRDTGKDEA